MKKEVKEREIFSKIRPYFDEFLKKTETMNDKSL